MIILSLNLISCCVSWCATSLGYCPALLYALNLQLNDGEQVTSCSLSTHSCLLSSLSCSQSPSLLISIEHHLLAIQHLLVLINHIMLVVYGFWLFWKTLTRNPAFPFCWAASADKFINSPPLEWQLLLSVLPQLWSLTLIRMTKDEKGLAFFKGVLL